MTLGIAARVTPGKVVGIDIDRSEIEAAIAKASHEGLQNVSFQTASCYALPVEDASFDRAFSNALMEHLAEPVLAMRELNRILKPGGIVGISGPDWSGFLLSPPSPALSRAVTAYTSLQAKNGGDVTVGRKLGLHLSAAGFVCVRMSARYECYASLGLIGEYLASQLERDGDQASADVFRTWAQHDGGMFAQAWVSAIATRP